MCTRLFYLISFVLVLSLVGDVQATNYYWTDVSPDHLWSRATNWDRGTLPTSADNVYIGMLPGPTIANEGAAANILRVGYGNGNNGDLTVDGGTLTVTGTLHVGPDEDIGTLKMISGAITAGSFKVANKGVGNLDVTGGTIDIIGFFQIADKSAAIGHVQLDGGVISMSANAFTMRISEGSVGTMDITAGTLIINGNAVSRLQGYIDNGWITAYDGNGTLQLDYDVTNEGKTTLKATHRLNPNPADKALVEAGDVELSWTSPDPCVPGQPVTVDVYFTDNLKLLEEFTDPAAIQVVSKQNVTSVVVQTQQKTQYYWAVDTYIGSAADPIFGPIFSFYADNVPPEVDAGPDIITWLDNGLRVVQLDGVVSDEGGGPGPATLLWTVIAEPNELNPAQISDPLAANPTVTVIELGSYTLQLEAGDGEYNTTDTMQIVLYADSCEHAKNQEGFELIPGDINEDCIVNELDLAILEEHWLEWNYSTE